VNNISLFESVLVNLRIFRFDFLKCGHPDRSVFFKEMDLERLRKAAELAKSLENELSPEALAALQLALGERTAAAEAAAKENDVVVTGPVLKTTEDYQLSQFWYSEETGVSLANLSRELAAEILLSEKKSTTSSSSSGDDNVDRKAIIACLSCPSVFKALLAVERDSPLAVKVDAYVFEFDKRFEVFGDKFVFYDYNYPKNLPRELLGQCDVILIDPPFLNRDTLEGFAKTVSLLQRSSSTRVLLCTGAVMLNHARELLSLRPTRAKVTHAQNRLSNPFALYVNFDVKEDHPFLLGIDAEAEAFIHQ